VEIVHRHFEDVNRRDWESVMAAYTDDVVLVVQGDVAPYAGIFDGREAVGRWFGDWFRAFGHDYRFDVEETQSARGRVLAVAGHHGHGRTSGVAVEQTTINVYTLRGVKVARVEIYSDRSEALKAVGLEE
jgi:ketosteroid isomerase-like protein